MNKIKEYLLEDKTPFAEGLSFKKMFILFIIFSYGKKLYKLWNIRLYNKKRIIIFRIIPNIWMGSVHHDLYTSKKT